MKRDTETDVAYCAGLVDGEGTIGLTKRDGPFISVASTEWALVYAMKHIFFSSGHIVERKARSSKHKNCFVWKVVGNTALDILELLLPYLREPYKRQKAKLLTEQYKLVTKRNGKYTVEERLKKLAFEEEFRAIGCSRVR